MAAISTGDAVESVLATDEDASSEVLYTSADTLTLLNTGSGAGRYVVEVVTAEAPSLTAGKPFERRFAEAGSLRLALTGVEASPTLRLRGAALDGTFVGQDGTVRQGRDLTVSGPGTLIVSHGPGPLVAWLEPTAADPRTLWDVPGLPAREAALPSTVPLEGEAMRLSFDPRETTLVQLRSAAALVTLLSRPELATEVEVHTAATSLDMLLPPGRSELLLRPSLDRRLEGVAELAATPVLPIVEGLGPEILLAPGSSRAFAFEVAAGGPVGLGVRASAEVAEATLLDAAGRRLGTGVSQMPTLAPGRYVLVVHASADGPAVKVRPAVAGLARPSTDPPLEVVQRYFEPDAAPLSFTSRYVEEPVETWREGETSDTPDEGAESFEEEMEDEEASEPPPGVSENGGGW